MNPMPDLPIDVSDLRAALLERRLYTSLDDAPALRHFMASHVYAVWDFQSLLTALQQRLTCVTVPWRPTTDREARRLINEIVLDEESGRHPDGGYASHFELYLDAMRAAGVSTRPIEAMMACLVERDVDEALRVAEVPTYVQAFVRQTFAIIEDGAAHRLVAAFFFGREDIIPEMFRRVVPALEAQSPSAWRLLRFYLDEHIECDDARHGPAAARLLRRVCGHDAQRWAEAEQTARQALEARIALWDGIVDSQPTGA